MNDDQYFTHAESEDQQLLKALRAAIGPAPRLDFSTYGDFDFEHL